ncbi:unnamed protein product [Adineta ricciae]|uniref:Uncharacterized protein n=1 Tax=Adineta ricciae TaxID=249248 RepID=A0A815U0B6_ADIRI|nr:unnamed protein product [Adineta ricciae]CAF1510031.1 unnamed protein product [Adineta ricciae]
MECSRCKNAISIEEYLFFFTHCTNTPINYSADFVLKTHESFHKQIVSSMTKEKQLQFFAEEHHDKDEADRPVLIHSILGDSIEHQNHCDDSQRKDISLIDMKLHQLAENCQLSLWIVTQAKLTNMIDGTIYMVARDKFDRHIRLVISNWSYFVITNEVKSMESRLHILDDLLPMGSMIKLHDPLLTHCSIDNQVALHCKSPNIDLILCDRIKKCFVLDKLDDLRERGNQAYIRGDLQLAVDYYTYAINRIITMAGMTMAKDDDYELNLFQNAFHNDLARLHSNRSACYLRQRLYSGASTDSAVVVTGKFIANTSDDLFLKCLYRLICSNIVLEDFSFRILQLLALTETDNIHPQLRWKYAPDFDQLNSNLTRIKDECAHGIYDVKKMFHQQYFDQKTVFDFETFHSNFDNTSLIKKRRDQAYAKCAIPTGTLLLVQNAFVYVKSGENEQERLLNELEKHFAMAPTPKEFDLIRMMPLIHQWFENETDAVRGEHETYPTAIPLSVLRKTQETNPFRTKNLVGWWPHASVFRLAHDSQQKSNCLWFVCGKTIFLFSYVPISKNEEIIMANYHKIGSFLNDNRKAFTFLFGKKTQVPLNDIFDELKQTQVYFSM